MFTTLVDILKTARPRQWVKNLTLYAALIFTGNVFSSGLWIAQFWTVTEAVAAFTLVASAVYFLNDLMDAKADAAHPFKKKRPIAAGRISKKFAVIMVILLAGSGLKFAVSLSPLFGLAVAGYFVMMMAYSAWLKHIEVVDVFVIAAGFFLRVVAGAIVINAHLSIWFLLCVISTSLFLAVGKRRAELSILTEHDAAIAHRKVMGKYSANILDSYLAMFATAAFLSWALYTFNFYEELQTTAPTSLALISKTLTVNKWLMVSIPVVIFGIMRYIRIIYEGARAESPERILFSDKPLLISVGLWGVIVLFVLYVAH
ncbi:MAG: UbiA prenyltransferase family protein [Patescibacteria group bacterium]